MEQASGFNYDELANSELTAAQMNEALLQSQIEVRPTTRPPRAKGAKRFRVDPITGEKTRIHDSRKGK